MGKKGVMVFVLNVFVCFFSWFLRTSGDFLFLAFPKKAFQKGYCRFFRVFVSKSKFS